MEGQLAYALQEVADPTIPLSWHFSVGKDGSLYQHYDTTAQCWHAHAVGNVAYVGIEHEGVAGEPETDAQVGTDIRLLAWLDEQESWPAIVRKAQLWEHNEIAGNATACPSGRIRWDNILAGLTVPVPAIPDAGEFAMSLASAAHFRRLGYNLADLNDGDKANLRWAVSQL